MHALRELQLALQAGILVGEAPAALDPAPQRRYRERFAAYADGYRIRLAGALRENFPVLHRILGDDAFAELASSFVDAQPSTTPSIRWLGSRLGAFVAANPDALPHPALADLVTFEWALGLAFDAADEPAVEREALAATAPADWPALRFRLHPSAHLVELDWAIEPIVRLLKDDPDAATPEPEADRHAVLTWRRDLDARWRVLDDAEAAALQRIAAGAPFGELCALLADRQGDAEAARIAAAMLSRWVDDRVLVAA